MSIDGYLDDATEHRLVLSNDADLDRVDEVRASCDAILVGAATVRNDNPRLLVRSSGRRDSRAAQGRAPNPLKVTITQSAKLDADASFFACGESEKLVYCASDTVDQARLALGHVATVLDGGAPVDVRRMCEDLRARGVRRLMVEGGGTTLTQFLAADLADELHLVVAPFFVGDSRAVRVVGDGPFPWHPGRRGTLLDVSRLDDLVLLRYALSERCPGG
jgi:5-amino-6-(5-phosphoribosylamino)uracil reductase